MKPIADDEWDDDVYVVHESARNTAVGRRGKLLVGYDPDHSRATQRRCCPAFLPDGTLCRMPREHEGPHVPFSAETVALTGVYVLARMEQ